MSQQIISRFRGQYAFLGNFFWVEDTTVEHLFQASKAMLTDPPDEGWHNNVLNARTAWRAKELGNNGPRPDNWNAELRVPVMEYWLGLKFNPNGKQIHRDLTRRLLDTEDATLIEGNDWHDNFWGDCTCGERLRCSDPGKNMLGVLLMQHRMNLYSTFLGGIN